MQFIGVVEGLVKKKRLELTKKIFEGVVARTPVLSGAARASWTVSAGVPIVKYVEPAKNVQGVQFPPPAFVMPDVPPYAKIFITNGAPYIQELEEGYSQKAPSGMMRVTLAQYSVDIDVR